MTRKMNDLRQAALDAGLKSFDGPPCDRCGSTQRYASNGNCFPCATTLSRLARQRERDANAAYGAARDTAMRSGAMTYFGKPCKREHSGERHTGNNGCVTCHAMPKPRREIDYAMGYALQDGFDASQLQKRDRYVSEFIRPISRQRLMGGNARVAMVD